MIRLAIRCRPEQAEVVLAELAELAPNGFEEERGPGYVEYAIYGFPGELPALPDLEAAAGAGLVAVETSEVPDDWADAWQDFHRPTLIADRLYVRPSWEPVASDPDLVDLLIHPGQAFGTGSHATTKLCLELLVELADAGHAGGPLIDLGTGSGVLAIAAAKLGWGPVRAFDHEPASLEAAASNAKVNGVELDLARVNLRETLPQPAQTTVANLTAPLLLTVAAAMAAREPVAERLICSGLLPDELDRVLGAFAASGLVEAERRFSWDWAALSLRRT